MKKKLKLLITGSNGLIARTFIESYRRNFKIITCTKKDSLEKSLRSNPDIIINAAAEQYNEKKMINANLNIVLKILKYCKKNKKKLIQFGSSAEYGVCNKPSKETFKLNPATLYEATKAAASELVTGFSRAYSLKAIVVRPYTVYGHHMKPERLIKLIINSIKSNTPLNIYRARHDYIYVKDFNRALKLIIEKSSLWSFGEIINIGSEKQLSNHQVMKVVEDVFQKKGNFTVINKFLKPWDSDCWVSNSRHLINKYKFKFKYTFRRGIIDLKRELEKKTNKFI